MKLLLLLLSLLLLLYLYGKISYFILKSPHLK